MGEGGGREPGGDGAGHQGLDGARVADDGPQGADDRRGAGVGPVDARGDRGGDEEPPVGRLSSVADAGRTLRGSRIGYYARGTAGKCNLESAGGTALAPPVSC